MTAPSDQYETFLKHIYLNGIQKGDRTGTGTRSIFGYQMRFKMDDGFPLVTTKKVFLKAIIVELLWFLRGDSNVKWLQDNGCTIWDEWAREDGSLGPVYGVQWRSWPTSDGGHIDQIADVIQTLKTNPDSRRILVSAWNVAELDQMALMPCHAMFQFYTRLLTVQERFKIWSTGWNDTLDDKTDAGKHEVFDAHFIPSRQLDLQLYQRSADAFLGVPFNIASYALLLHMVAKQVNMKPGEFIWTGGDCHIYSNHEEQVKTQLLRTPYPYPTLKLEHRSSIFKHEVEDFNVLGYAHYPPIKAPIAV